MSQNKWMLDAGCWILDTGYWMLDTGCWLLKKGRTNLPSLKSNHITLVSKGSEKVLSHDPGGL